MVLAGWEAYLERLGPQGLRVVAASLLAPRDFERLTEQSGSELTPVERAEQLVDRAGDDPHLGESLLAALDARTGDLEQDPSDWSEREVREALARVLRTPDAAGAALLHRLARSRRPPLDAAEIRATAEIVAPAVLGEQTGTRPKYVAKLATDRTSVRELEQVRRELESRIGQLEARASRALERVAALETELEGRLREIRELKRGERASREERQRLERELARLRQRIEVLNARRARERTGEITTALRRLTTEQRRSGSQLKKMNSSDADRRSVLREQTRQLTQLADLIEKMIALQEAESRATAAAQEAILQELGEQRAELSDNGQGEPASRNRGKDGDGETRVGVFVDVQNMFYGARGKQGRLDFAALLAAATSGRRLVRAVAYLVEAPEIDQRAFIHLLQMKAYEVKRKPLRIRADKTMKGNWDLEMALDALTTAEHVDVVVLVTGDGDFLPLVRQLKLRGKRVEIYGFPRSTAPDLRQAADRFYGITRRLLRPLEPTKNARRNTSLKTGSRSAATSGSATEKSSESATSDAPASSS